MKGQTKRRNLLILACVLYLSFLLVLTLSQKVEGHLDAAPVLHTDIQAAD